MSMVARLVSRAREFDLFFALRVLDAQAPSAPRLGCARRPTDEGVRLAQTPSLAFAPSTIDRVEPPAGQRPWHRIAGFSFGVFGPNGPLPLHLTEYAAQRESQSKDGTLSAFMDIFHHRMTSLFYRAWASAQPTVQADRPQEDRFAAYVASLIGLGLVTTQERDAVADAAKLYFGGYYACATRHPDGLRALLSAHLRVPVDLEEFVGEWVDLPHGQGFVLGDRGEGQVGSRLGRGTVIGRRIWLCQHKFRVVLGPLEAHDFERLQHDGESLEALVSLVRGYAGPEYAWDVRLTLRQEQRLPLVLGQGRRLGRSSWLTAPTAGGSVEDLVFDPERALQQRRARARAPVAGGERPTFAHLA